MRSALLAVTLPLATCTPHPGPPDSGCAQVAAVPSFTGSVHLEGGQPAHAAKVQLCNRLENGARLCLRPVDTDSSGDYVIDVAPEARCMTEAAVRVVPQSDDYASTYCLQSLANTRGAFTLHATSPAVARPPPGDAGTARSVRFADGIEIDMTPSLLLPAPSVYERLRSRRLAAVSASGLCFLPDSSSLEAVFGFSPEAQQLGSSFPVRIAHDAGWPSGTSVSLFALGGIGCAFRDGGLLEEGHWVRVGSASVNADGTQITGGELPCLTWFGYARAN